MYVYRSYKSGTCVCTCTVYVCSGTRDLAINRLTTDLHHALDSY